MQDNIPPVKTIKTRTESVYKEKNSVFKAELFPVISEEEIQNYLRNTRKQYYDAVHHCYAYRLRNNNFKYSDDGEPNGTAGIRILNAIDHFGLSDILCIISRWFGGIKLGVGPLGKAYYTAADGALKVSEIIIKSPFKPYSAVVPYQFSSQFYYILDKYKVIISGTAYKNEPEYDILIPYNNAESFIVEIRNTSGGQIFLKEKPEIHYL